MPDLRKLVSYKSRMEIARDWDRILDFQKMGRKEMASELISAARDLADSGVFKSDYTWSYDEWAIYRVLPALARRLDPEIELRESEIPKEDESRDLVTSIEEGNDEKLLSHVGSIISNVSFMRAQKCDRDSPARRAANFLIMHRSDCSAISIAMDTVCPGSYPKRATPDVRPPLEGFQVIAVTASGYDCVLRYGEVEDDVNDWFRVGETIAKNEEIEEGDEAIASRLRSYISPDDWVKLAIQNCSTGEIINQVALKDEEPETVPTL